MLQYHSLGSVLSSHTDVTLDSEQADEEVTDSILDGD